MIGADARLGRHPNGQVPERRSCGAAALLWRMTIQKWPQHPGAAAIFLVMSIDLCRRSRRLGFSTRLFAWWARLAGGGDGGGLAFAVLVVGLTNDLLAADEPTDFIAR